MNRRFVITNIDLVKEFEDKGKVPFYWPPHYASWEQLLTINENKKI
jgi:KDO2-lipid IV(A) lauroyltransferase